MCRSESPLYACPIHSLRSALQLKNEAPPQGTPPQATSSSLKKRVEHHLFARSITPALTAALTRCESRQLVHGCTGGQRCSRCCG